MSGLPSRALLWLTLGFGVLLLPQWDRLPVWLLAACGVLAGWRWLAQAGRLALPGRWPRLGLMAVLIGLYIAQVRGQFTVDTAASFFVLAVALKWLETRTGRDFYVLFFILCYLAAVNFLFHQEILWALLNFAGLLLLLVSVQSLQAPDLPKGFGSGWRRLGGLMIRTLPVVALLFVFFPRIAPLWSVPLVSGQARTGMTDTMTPGDISNLAQSSERAFRVTFGADMPPYPERYWRGLILDRLDGDTWRQSGERSWQAPGRVAMDGGAGELKPREYDVLLEPTDQRWAFALDDSVAASDNVRSTGDGLFRFQRPADSQVRYRLRRETNAGDIPPLSRAEWRQYLQLPGSGNPRARALASRWSSSMSDEALILALMRRFRTEPYYYTLRPPAMPDDGVDALLFDVRRGFCAHYAGATAFLLRAAGIPARIVVGYQGGEPGAGGDYLIVRQYDAHAWVEAWLNGRGWVRIDPTAAIAPARVESGLRDAVADEGSFLEDETFSAEKYRNLPLVNWASLQLDRLNYQWQRWVVGYQGQSQMDLMSRLPGNFGLRELGYLSAGVIGAGLLLAGIVSAWRMRRNGGRGEMARLVGGWHRLCEQRGLPVRHGETPLALAERLGRARPAVAEDARRFARIVNNHYYGRSTGDARLQYRQLRRLLRAMRRQLRQPVNPVPGGSTSTPPTI